MPRAQQKTILAVKRIASAASAAAAVYSARSAAAQPRGDVGVELGALERVLTNRTPGSPTLGLGAAAEVHAHIALLPMVRIGPYVAYDAEPVSGWPARETIEAGLRLKVTPPALSSPWHLWAFVGLGYARTYEPSHVLSAASASVERTPGAGGGMVDLPFGLGIGPRVRGPWTVFAELAGRVGLAFTGTLYERPQCACSDPYAGRDSLAAELSVGVSLGQ